MQAGVGRLMVGDSDRRRQREVEKESLLVELEEISDDDEEDSRHFHAASRSLAFKSEPSTSFLHSLSL